MIILGIETSCDETGAAIVRGTELTKPLTLLSNTLATSLTLHAGTGGIIPEIAAREQLKYCIPVIDQALKEARVTKDEIDAIAVTSGPGLIGSLLVGVESAKTLAYLWKKPLIPVNHLYGHIYANWITTSDKRQAISDMKANDQRLMTKDPFPALALVVSGGHTDLVHMIGHENLKVIGGTRDDAAGEAFDKIGRLLGLSYPAGAVIANLAQYGNPQAFPLPRPMIGSGDYDFSFSGLKTAVLNLTKKNNWDFTDRKFHSKHESLLSDLCASVEEAIIDSLVRKTLKAAQEYEVKTILLGGGVAANDKLQSTLRQRTKDQRLRTEISVPPKFLCTDNAAMVAAAAFYNRKITPWQEVTANPELYF
jgi:N6-L-threonylcarbamoyladenine synthase